MSAQMYDAQTGWPIVRSTPPEGLAALTWDEMSPTQHEEAFVIWEYRMDPAELPARFFLDCTWLVTPAV